MTEPSPSSQGAFSLRHVVEGYRHLVRLAWEIILAAPLLLLCGWCAVRLVGAESGAPMLQLMAFTPYVAAASLAPLAAALLSGLWWHAGVAAALVVALLGSVLPRAVPGGGRAEAGGRRGPSLRVLTANLFVGSADPVRFIALLRSGDIDVLAVQELTPAAVAALDEAGLATLMPHRALYPTEGGKGSGVYSHHPLTDPGLRRLPSSFGQAYATVHVPGSVPVVVESAHPRSPSDRAATRRWAKDIAEEPPATSAGPPRVLLGDFNSTLDHAGLRALIATGYRDAAAATGSGLRPTWPFSSIDTTIHGVRLPPVTLDHVLADRRLGIRAVSVHPITGSDHRAVRAELMLPAA